MRLLQRYRRLTIWNKLAAVGSVASIIALVLYCAERVPSIVTFDDPLAGATDWRDHTFDLVRDPGAELVLGPCPGPRCYRFAFGEVTVRNGVAAQTIHLDGDGFGLRRNPRPGQVLELRARVRTIGASLGLPVGDRPITGLINLTPGSGIIFCTEALDVRLVILELQRSTLQMRVSVKPGSWEERAPEGERCPWIDAET